MVNFGKMIDKLIEISTNQDLSDEVKFQLDEVIDELVNFEIEKNGGRIPIPDFRDLSPEDLEEIKQFELFVRDVMNNRLALAWVKMNQVMVDKEDLEKVLRVIIEHQNSWDIEVMELYAKLYEIYENKLIDEKDVSLDEMIWDMGLSLPSWED